MLAISNDNIPIEVIVMFGGGFLDFKVVPAVLLGW